LAGWHRSQISDKTSFFEVMSEIKKDPEDVSAGIGILTNKALKKFSCNLSYKSWQGQL
jgi:hypothetical protein